MRNQRKHSARRETRRGLAVTELALCLPVLVLLILGSIESCNMIFVRHALSVAGYEAVRVAIRKNATATEAEAAANELLAGRGIDGSQVTVHPSNLSSVQPGELIRIEITAPAESNRVISPWYFTNTLIESNTTMAKE